MNALEADYIEEKESWSRYHWCLGLLQPDSVLPRFNSKGPFRACAFPDLAKGNEMRNPRNPQASTQSEFLRTFRMIYQPFLQ